MRKVVITLVGLMFSLVPIWLTSGSAMAAALWDTYVPPEVTFADDLRQRITIPTKVDVNRGNLNELKVLPGLDEEIALKIMRGRPFAGIQDFYRKLPGLDKQSIDRLIQQVQPKLLFK